MTMGKNMGDQETIMEVGKVRLDLTHYPGEDLYCDDDAVENELLDIVKNYSAVEYQRIIEERQSWTLLYHLSPLRENIVEWIPMEGSKALEVGSGCGAVTGVLARKAAQVVSVDLSKKRSLINAYRHSDCDNLVIHVGNFKDIEPTLPADFDYIFLIGVFEYGQSYMGTDRPFEEFLQIVMKHLAPGGRVVIAIENKYGLKYFAGCKEDHLGTWFSGIENYADGGYVRTFSRQGLEKIFDACGVKDYSFYYPYPDYKFMTTLYSDKRLPGKGELSNNLRNYDRERLDLFDEKYAFDGLAEDALFPVFSNSYEVIIGKELPIQYTKYSNDRAPAYQIKTEISMEPDRGAGIGTREKPVIKKLPLCKEAEAHIRQIAASYQKLADRYEGGKIRVNPCVLHEEEGKIWDSFAYEEGLPLAQLLDEKLEKGDIEGFHALFREYLERIGYHEEYPVADFDMIFSNIIVQDDEWTIIDYEWTYDKVIDPKELAFRAIYCYLLEDEKRNKLNVDLILNSLGMSEADMDDCRVKERKFQKQVTGRSRSMSELYAWMGAPVINPWDCLEREKQRLVPRRVQIYEDCGGGFSEEKSYFVSDGYLNDEDVELQLTVDGNVQMVRIDPAMESCVVSVEELTFNGKDVPVRSKAVFTTNGKTLKSSSAVVFATSDPNLSINVAGFERKPLNVLCARLKVVILPMAVAEDMAASVKKWI